MVSYKNSPVIFEVGSLKDEIETKEKRLSELLSLKESKKDEIRKLKRQLQSKPVSRFIQVYCPGCMNYHTFSYFPGRYEMCQTRKSVPRCDFPFMLGGSIRNSVTHYALTIDPSYEIHMTNLSMRKDVNTRDPHHFPV